MVCRSRLFLTASSQSDRGGISSLGWKTMMFICVHLSGRRHQRGAHDLGNESLTDITVVSVPPLLGGMRISDYLRTPESTSYFATYFQVRGVGQYESQMLTIWSTASPARAGVSGEARSWLQYDVWAGEEDWAKFPLVEHSAWLGRVSEVFPSSVSSELENIMDYFEERNIQYQYCWVGYHVWKWAVCKLHPLYCPLDVFYQDSRMRREDPKWYRHWLITDQVAPCEAYASSERLHQGVRHFETI